MEFMFDTVHLDTLKRSADLYPFFTGVTSNPTIFKREGPVDFFGHLRQVRRLIGHERTLHVQITADKAEDILDEAEAVLGGTGDDAIFIKVPADPQGIKAMSLLKARGIGVTATAIYTKIQGFLAICAGADYIAPYCNRIESQNVDIYETIAALRRMIDENVSDAKILAAGFKTPEQLTGALLAGAHCVTVMPELLDEAMDLPNVRAAIAAFKQSWTDVRGDVRITQM
ncbi:MAG: fructose-6-phosphate aldolase [Christensenellales bacterium]|jgi:transaldolase